MLKAVVAAFNQEKDLVWSFSVIVKSSRRFVWSSSGRPPEDGHFAGIRPLQFALYSNLYQLRSNVRNDGNGGTGSGQFYLTPLQGVGDSK